MKLPITEMMEELIQWAEKNKFIFIAVPVIKFILPRVKELEEQSIVEYKKWLLEEMHKNDEQYAHDCIDVKNTWRDALRIIESYNLPTK